MSLHLSPCNAKLVDMGVADLVAKFPEWKFYAANNKAHVSFPIDANVSRWCKVKTVLLETRLSDCRPQLTWLTNTNILLAPKGGRGHKV